MKVVIKPGYTNFVIKCTSCKCVFSYEREDIEHPHVYDFAHLSYVSCPSCGHNIFIKKNKIKKRK